MVHNSVMSANKKIPFTLLLNGLLRCVLVVVLSLSYTNRVIADGQYHHGHKDNDQRNLIENGSFEDHPRLERHGSGFCTRIPGWTAKTGEIQLSSHKQTHIKAKHGKVALQADAHENASVTQDVSTQQGGRYQLHFLRVTGLMSNGNTGKMMTTKTPYSVLPLKANSYP